MISAERWARRNGYCRDALLLVGHSMGGLASLAAAEALPGVRAVVCYSAVQGSGPTSERRMESLYAGLGARLRCPVLALYGENDRLCGAAPAGWYRAFRVAGGRMEFRTFRLVGRHGRLLDGDGLLPRAGRQCAPYVLDFLGRAGLRPEASRLS